MLTQADYLKIFKIGEIIQSGASDRRTDAAHLEILSIDRDRLRYKSLKNKASNAVRYSYLQILIDDYESLDGNAIQKSVNAVLKKNGQNANYSTENYSYTLAKAIHERTSSVTILLPDEEIVRESEMAAFVEGKRFTVTVERIERDSKAREKCIRHFGPICQACGFNFLEKYGEIGRDFIHVHHHRRMLSDLSGESDVDPIKDLVPLCPNCHAMAHSRKKMFSTAELRALLKGGPYIHGKSVAPVK